MEKKTMETLRTMICGELDDIAKKGTLSHETLDILKDLLESAKNLEKIEKYQKEKKEKEMDMGYSQRKYYIDADYQPPMGPNSYARGGQGNSYGYSMGRTYDGGSYMYNPGYDPMSMYSMARGNSYGMGYSRHGDKQEMVMELQQMMSEATDESIKNAISDAISKIK